MVEVKKFKLKRHEVAVKILGKKNKKPIILLHGWNGSSDSLLKLGEEMAKKFKVYIPDQTGFGGSEEPKRPWRVVDYAEQMSELIKKEKLRDVVLFGHSLGGLIAAGVTATDKRIKKLVLCGSTGLELGIRWKMILFKILTRFGSKFFRERGPFSRLVCQLFEGDECWLVSDKMQESIKLILETSIMPLLEEIKIPVLLIWAENDLTTPIMVGRRMERHLDNSRLKIVLGADHELPIKGPEITARVMKKWLCRK